MTGAPGENLCIDCHADYPLNSGGGSLQIQGPPYYRPGETYTVRVRLAQPGKSRWGFQLTALTGAGETAGSLIVTEPSFTQGLFSPSLNRRYIAHRLPGTFPETLNGPVWWSMEWQAPGANLGPVTLYASGNAANRNGSPGGDHIYSASFRVNPATVFDTTMFRSFRPESLIVRSFQRKVIAATGWEWSFVNRTAGIVSSLEIRFKKPAALTRYAPFPDAYTPDGGLTWYVSGQEIVPGDSVTVFGTGPKSGTIITSWQFAGGTLQPGFEPPSQRGLLPMPNAANVRYETFLWGGFAPGTSQSDALGGMRIGRSFLRFQNGRWRVDSDSVLRYGWVRLRAHRHLYRSLRPRPGGLTHIGPPQGFTVFNNGRPFIRQQTTLSPEKMNNRLFAELVALKLGIASSALGITPPGFGEILYADGGHPLDGMMITEIARTSDSLMTRWHGRDTAVYAMLDSVVRKINGAFSGPMDTLSFARFLALKGVRPLAEVPFLRVNPDVQPVRIPLVYQPEFEEPEEEEGEELVPEMILTAQNYPNPFNPATRIQFELGDMALVTVKVYDVAGRQVAVLADRELLFDGTNEVEFDARGLASGVYFYRITAEAVDDVSPGSRAGGKMVLVK